MQFILRHCQVTLYSYNSQHNLILWNGKMSCKLVPREQNNDSNLKNFLWVQQTDLNITVLCAQKWGKVDMLQIAPRQNYVSEYSFSLAIVAW